MPKTALLDPFGFVGLSIEHGDSEVVGYIQLPSSDITHATESHYPFRRTCDDQYVYRRDVASGPIEGEAPIASLCTVGVPRGK